MKMIKSAACAVLILGLAWSSGAQNTGIDVTDLAINGKIEKDNIVFTLSFSADVEKKNLSAPIVSGDLAHLRSDLPRKAELSRSGDAYIVKFASRGRQSVVFEFAGRAIKDGEWRQTVFSIPAASIRKLAVVCDRDDLEIQFPGALSVERKKNKEGLMEVTAFLGLAKNFTVRWKPTVKKLDAELVVACDVNTIASASVGVLKLDNLFTYRVVQGTLRKFTFALPPNLNITQVTGEDIQDWGIENGDSKNPVLGVTLSRARDSVYMLRVEGETILPKFPCDIELPVLVPQDVIRSSGFLMFGTDSAIRMLVGKAMGLTQVDQAAFPVAALNHTPQARRSLPARSRFAYQYANMPYTLALTVNDIIPEYNSNAKLVLSVRDEDLTFSASVELDVRDAPLREVVLETDPRWVVAHVDGPALLDYDVRDADGKRRVHVYFREAVLGRTLIDVRLEQSTALTEVDVPLFRVAGAKSQRGDLVIAAEKGLRIRTGPVTGLREVQTGSVETQVDGAQLAYRFKEPDWKLSLALDRIKPAIHSEILHLLSIGEGVLYGSSAITYHIDGAPLRTLKISIPEIFQNVEFTGRDIRRWDRNGEIWTVFLQEKIIGDFTLLLTYDRPITQDRHEVAVGGVRTLETSSESGYIVMAGSSNLKLEEKSLDTPVIAIDRREIPDAYALLVNDPIMKAYKYNETPHVVSLDVRQFDTEMLLSQVADHTVLNTEISRDGEAVTTILYAVKNLSRQYLVISLPPEAQLWSTRLVDDAGRAEIITSMREGDKTMIPIRRLQDPNRPVRVEVKYAESFGELGKLGRRVAFSAPAAEEFHSTFARWTYELPNGFTVGRAGGNMTPDAGTWTPGVVRVMRSVLAGWGTLFLERGAWLIIILALFCLAAYTRGRARGFVPVVILGGLVVVVLALAVFPSAVSAVLDSQALLEPVNPTGPAFSKTVSLVEGDPMEVTLSLVPSWVGWQGSLSAALILAAFGVWMLVRAGGWKTVKPSRAALGLTALTLAFAGLAAGRIFLSAVLAVVVPVAILVWAMGRCYRAGCRRREKTESNAEIASPFEEIPDEPAPPLEPAPENPEPDGREGSARPALLLWLFLALIAGTAGLARAGVAPGDVSALPTVKSVILNVEAPRMTDELEKSVKISATMDLQIKEPGSYFLLRAPAVLTAHTLGSRRLSIDVTRDGYVLNVAKKSFFSLSGNGEYTLKLTYSMPVVEKDGAWFVGLGIPANLQNKVTIRIPEVDLDVESPDAVLFKTTEKDGVSEAVAVYGSVTQAHIAWKARVRKTKLEKVVFFCEVNTLAVFEPGVVEMTHFVGYQVAQGEMKSMTLGIPAGMTVTAVKAQGLSTWRFDPETRVLEAILDKPVSGDFNLHVVTQVPCEGLPYVASVGTLEVKEAVRQRGSVTLAVPETVQILVDRTEGLNPMNIEDIPAAIAQATGGDAGRGRSPAVSKRAFRYHSLPVSASVRAERVLPEIRVVESGSLSLSDERVFLSTQLKATVSKAGIFSLHLGLPDGFDVETLTGQDVSHWDEVGTAAASSPRSATTNEPAAGTVAGRGVVVHFRKQVTGTRVINVVVARSEKGVGETIVAPRISVTGALKHSGTLVVSGERGIRMATVEKDGVSEVNPREMGIREEGVLAFRLLRPEWRITLQTETVAPTIRSEILQRIDLSEGALQCASYIQYRIDHAGCKVFRLKAPAPGVALAVTGEGISRVHEIDTKEGIWEVELHNKVENNYALQVRYKLSFDAASQKARIKPLLTEDVESQKGYLAILSSGRVQVKPMGPPVGLKQEDARSIPAGFEAGDLSDAILCYRTVGGDFDLELSVIRHDAAEVLPAQVDRILMTSVVSGEGHVLTQVKMDMTVGDLRFLEMTLPDEESALWSAFVNGKAVPVSREGAVYRIPLEEPVPGEPTAVELIYASPFSRRWFSNRQDFYGPKFDLPLRKIQWTFYVDPHRRYYGFDGTMESVPEEFLSVAFTEDMYLRANVQRNQEDQQKAEKKMEWGRQSARQGQQKLARKALESAVNYSQGDQVFNEDARIEYRNLAQQQAVVGLVQRRDEMRFNRNIQDAGQLKRLENFKGGNFTADYAEEVQQSLTGRDNTSLQRLADKIMDQQMAAERVTQAIRITLPTHGKKLEFHRSLQVDPSSDLQVSFKVSSGVGRQWLWMLIAAGVLFLLFRHACRRGK